MAKINLLPWRETLRKERQRQFSVVAIGSAMLMVLIIVYIHLHFSGLIREQESRNTFLEKQISQVNKNIEEIQTLEADKENLLARMDIIQQLQRSRPEIVHLFYETAKMLPNGVYLTKISKTNMTVKIEGVAQSNANVSRLMKNLDASDWLDNPVLDIIDSSKKQYPDASWFNLHANLKHPDDSQGQTKK